MRSNEMSPFPPEQIRMFTSDPMLIEQSNHNKVEQQTVATLQYALEKKCKDLENIKKKRIKTLDDLVTTKSRSLSQQMRQDQPTPN